MWENKGDEMFIEKDYASQTSFMSLQVDFQRVSSLQIRNKSQDGQEESESHWIRS